MYAYHKLGNKELVKEVKTEREKKYKIQSDGSSTDGTMGVCIH